MSAYLGNPQLNAQPERLHSRWRPLSSGFDDSKVQDRVHEQGGTSCHKPQTYATNRMQEPRHMIKEVKLVLRKEKKYR